MRSGFLILYRLFEKKKKIHHVVKKLYLTIDL